MTRPDFDPYDDMMGYDPDYHDDPDPWPVAIAMTLMVLAVWTGSAVLRLVRSAWWAILIAVAVWVAAEVWG